MTRSWASSSTSLWATMTPAAAASRRMAAAAAAIFPQEGGRAQEAKEKVKEFSWAEHVRRLTDAVPAALPL